MIEILGADAYFLWEESRARHMHTLKIAVVDPANAHNPITLELVRAGARAVLPHMASFRLRPVEIPLGLGHPLWVDAPALDLDYHIRHERLPPDAGEHGLDALASRIASEPLDRQHPLWQIFFVDGLPHGRIAYMTKIHHSVADGGAAAEIALRSFQETPDPIKLPAGFAAVNEAVPSAARRLGIALQGEMERLRELPNLVRRSLHAIGVSRRWKRQGLALPPSPFSSPATRFNRPITPNRIYAHTALPLHQLRAVKQAFGCTINDVYLSLVGGALRRYLSLKGELSSEALTAAVPVSVRRPEDEPSFGNATAYWFASTGSSFADPVDRLHAVTESTRSSREHFAARDARLAVDWLDHWPLRRAYLDGLQRVASAIVRRPSYNVIVSNVRGPSRPLYSDGARVEALYSMGPLTLQQGLNFTAWSYLDDFTVGLHACREHVPDLHWIAEALSEELEELSQRAAGSRQTGAARDPRRSRE